MPIFLSVSLLVSVSLQRTYVRHSRTHNVRPLCVVMYFYRSSLCDTKKAVECKDLDKGRVLLPHRDNHHQRTANTTRNGHTAEARLRKNADCSSLTPLLPDSVLLVEFTLSLSPLLTVALARDSLSVAVFLAGLSLYDLPRESRSVGTLSRDSVPAVLARVCLNST